MTDLEKLENTFNELGIKYEKDTLEEVRTVSYDGQVTYNATLYLGSGIGYMGFCCEYYFLDGKFINHGCWE